MTDEVKNIFGSIPIDYANYWLNKFPYLTSHAYHVMQRCSKESTLARFFVRYFAFSKPDYLSDKNYDNIELLELIQKIRTDNFYGSSINGDFKKSEKKSFGSSWNRGKSKRGCYNFKNSESEN